MVSIVKKVAVEEVEVNFVAKRQNTCFKRLLQLKVNFKTKVDVAGYPLDKQKVLL